MPLFFSSIPVQKDVSLSLHKSGMFEGSGVLQNSVLVPKALWCLKGGSHLGFK